MKRFQVLNSKVKPQGYVEEKKNDGDDLFGDLLMVDEIRRYVENLQKIKECKNDDANVNL